MSKRVATGIALTVIAIAAIILEQILPLLPFPGLGDLRPFHYLISFGFAMAAFEIIFSRRPSLAILPQLAVLGLAISYFLSTRVPAATIILLFLASFGYDTFAFVLGKKYGDRFFKGRPFPRISPNKTWEGLVGGTCASFLLCLIYIGIISMFGFRAPLIYTIFAALGGTIAWLGDLLASATKRTTSMKDGDEVLKSLPVLRHIERLMDGHGGFLDRLDSLALVCAVIYLITFLI